MTNLQTYCTYALILLSTLKLTVEITLNLNHQEVSTTTDNAWNLIFLFGTIFWAYHDQNRKEFKKPFDFGFLMYIFWPVAFPWYLIRTRGVDGLIMYIGFLGVWLGPWLGGLVAYIYFT